MKIFPLIVYLLWNMKRLLIIHGSSSFPYDGVTSSPKTYVFTMFKLKHLFNKTSVPKIIHYTLSPLASFIILSQLLVYKFRYVYEVVIWYIKYYDKQ